MPYIYHKQLNGETISLNNLCLYTSVCKHDYDKFELFNNQ